MRQAIVAGRFYPSNKDELRKQVEKFFSSLDVASLKQREIRAAIVPHAGYTYSGKCASFVYHLLRNSRFDTFIILGTNHSGLGDKVSLSIEDFDAPFGRVESDIDIVEDLISWMRDVDVGVSEEAHRYEHSIEVQLPFLQLVQKKFKVVACVLRDLRPRDAEEIGRTISSIIKKHEKKGKKIFVLASSDFTHYGKAYGFVPFSQDVRENLYELDERAIGQILRLDTAGFLAEASKTVCGKDAIACLIETAKNLDLKPEKLCYYTSGDVSDDWKSAVGYGSVVFY
jgi:AmmeMemoRadiSam system protein B